MITEKQKDKFINDLKNDPYLALYLLFNYNGKMIKSNLV